MPPHERLHQHALQSIFAQLTFRELAAALRVSRDWQSAVLSMRALGSGKILHPAENMAAALSSRMARHVSAVGQSSEPVALPLAQLQQLAARTPLLQHLGVRITTDAVPWGSELRLLRMRA